MIFDIEGIQAYAKKMKLDKPFWLIYQFHISYIFQRNFEGIEIPRDLIERGRELGTGSFGTVYAGVYQHENGEMNCAIKEAKNSMLREQLLGEADLMR